MGSLNNKASELPRFKGVYYKSLKSQNNFKYYNSLYIVSKFQKPLYPILNQNNTKIFYQFDQINTYFLNLNIYTKYSLYKYISNYFSVNYAIQNFYDAISVTPIAQLNANNTGENYFNSEIFTTSNYNNTFYFYIIALNQNKTKFALTSNVQIYDKSNNSSIETINTSPELPPISSKIYPKVNIDNFPIFTGISLPINSLITNNIGMFNFIERLSYNPINYNHSDYNYVKTSLIFCGPQLSEDQTNFLSLNYNLNFVDVTF